MGSTLRSVKLFVIDQDVCEGEKPTKKPAITTNTEQVHVETHPKMVPAKRSLPPHEEKNASKKPALSEWVVHSSKKVH